MKIIGEGKIIIKKDKSKHEANVLKLDINKTRSILKWKPKLNFNENIRLTFQWYKNYYQKTDNPIKFTNDQIRSFYEKK